MTSLHLVDKSVLRYQIKLNIVILIIYSLLISVEPKFLSFIYDIEEFLTINNRQNTLYKGQFHFWIR